MNQDQAPRCGNDPRAQLTDGDRQAVQEFRQYLADRKAQTAQPINLDAIQARCDAAEDGWIAVRDTDNPYRFEIHGNGPTNVAVLGGDPDDAFASYPVEENARFIAAARADVPALIARVRELEAEVERLSAVRAEVRSAIALDLMELHDDPATPERNRAGLRAAARRIPVAQDGGY